MIESIKISSVDDLSNDVINSLNVICSATGQELTDEQKVFAADFTKPTISFSDAGTGKTYACAVGLVHAQSYHKVRGEKICVLSFTKEATRLISERYKRMRKFTFVEGNVAFGTFHAVCNKILRTAWVSPTILPRNNYNDDIPKIVRYMSECGIEEPNEQWARNVLNAINHLNSSFIFDPEHMKQSYVFTQLRIDPYVFNKIRKKWFISQEISQTIPQGDIPLHCYYLLRRNKQCEKMFKKIFDILVVDEFQDMSILYIKIIEELTKSAVVIGDMKQQIYAFNGASDDIQDEFLRAFPDARVCPLTQSFRCMNNIVDYAVKLEEPNKPLLSAFKGVCDGGVVDTLPRQEMEFDAIVNAIYNMQQNLETVKQTDIMFLCRNNFSNMIVIEQLYKKGVKFRTSKFNKVQDMPIFRELCIMCEAIDDGYNEDKVWNCLRLFDEFKYTRKENCGVLFAMRKSMNHWLDTPYKYSDHNMDTVVDILKTVRDMMYDEKPAGVIFMRLLPIYDELIIKNQYWRLELPKEFYLNLVAPIANDKPYQLMRNEEFDKEGKNMQNMKLYEGVRCYTIHSAKGLEADEVYIIDCDQGIIPSDKNMEKYVKAKCLYEAARVIRNERNLLYVAVTRAREKVHICYNTKLSELISNPAHNNYSYLDEIYENTDRNYEDVADFLALFSFKEV